MIKRVLFFLLLCSATVLVLNCSGRKTETVCEEDLDEKTIKIPIYKTVEHEGYLVKKSKDSSCCSKDSCHISLECRYNPPSDLSAKESSDVSVPRCIFDGLSLPFWVGDIVFIKQINLDDDKRDELLVLTRNCGADSVYGLNIVDFNNLGVTLTALETYSAPDIFDKTIVVDVFEEYFTRLETPKIKTVAYRYSRGELIAVDTDAAYTDSVNRYKDLVNRRSQENRNLLKKDEMKWISQEQVLCEKDSACLYKWERYKIGEIKKDLSKTKYKVAVFSGHTGTEKDHGMISSQGVKETVYNDKLTKKICKEVAKDSISETDEETTLPYIDDMYNIFDVIYTGMDIVEKVPSEKRYESALSQGADLIMEIYHGPAMPEEIEKCKNENSSCKDMSGYAVFYCSDSKDNGKSRQIAELIGQYLKENDFKPNLHYSKKTKGAGQNIIYPQTAVYDVCFNGFKNLGSVPLVVVEAGVIANDKNEFHITEEGSNYHDVFASAVKKAIKEYFMIESKDPDVIKK